jgi:tetratricopeptide (TPR) repeat protein
VKRGVVCIRLCVIVITLFGNWPFLAAGASGEDLRTLGRKAFQEGKYVDAEQYLRQSLAVFEAQHGGSDVEVGITRGDLGSLLVIEHRLAEAEPLLESALGVLSKSKVQDCKNIVTITNHLAILFSTTQRHERAEAAFKRALSQSEHCAPRITPTVLNSMGVFYGRIGKLKQATTVLEKALTLTARQPDIEPAVVALALTALGAVHEEQRNYSRAEELLNRALHTLQQRKDAAPSNLADALLVSPLERLAMVYCREGKFDDAERTIHRAMDIELSLATTDRIMLSRLSFTYGEVMAAKGKYVEAAEHYQRSLQNDAENNKDTAITLEQYSKLLRKMNDDVQAEEAEFRAKKIRATLAYTTSPR